MNSRNDADDFTAASPQESPAMRIERNPFWIRFAGRFFPQDPGDLAELLDTDRHSTVFDHQRARFIVSRVHLMAGLFAVLTPLWIPVDALVFPQALWHGLALGRVITSFAFAALTFYCHRTTSRRGSYLALAGLFLIPSTFFLFSHAVLLHAQLNRVGAVMASGYAFLPFVLVAGISIFPLTVVESAILAVPLLAMAGIPVAARHAFMMPGFDAIAVLWLLVLVAGVGCLSAVSQLQLMHNLFSQAVIDPLTGVFNRKSGTELIALQFALAHRHQYPFAVAFIDLDDFKRVNDSAGHDVGDKILIETAQSWRACLRASDAVVRWGGEEFLLLLPHTDCKEAENLVLHRLPALRKSDGKLLTFSIGIAEWRADCITQWRPLVALADQRMYQAKAAGKACIVGCTANARSSVRANG